MLKRADHFDISGNAVMISNNVAITATHVLLNNNVGSFSNIDISNKREIFYPDESLNILINSIKYTKGFMMNVHRAVILPNCDISILYLVDTTSTTPDDAWNKISLNIIPPVIDSHVFTIGSVLEPGGHTIEGNIIQIDPKYVASFGLVANFMIKHPQYSGPGFYSTLTAFNTQSGSPVFNKDKELVGVISGGPDDHTTYVSALYPLFINSFVLEGNDAFHLYNAAKEGAIDCRNLHEVKIMGRDVSITLPGQLIE